MNLGRTKKYIIVFYTLVFLAVFCLTCLTPMIADDFSYSFSYADRSHRIRTLSDIYYSLKAHRVSMNGRMISHALAMFFLILPKPVFNVFNAANAVFLLFLCCRYYDGKATALTGRNLVFAILTALLLWIFMPMFGQVFLWLVGALNYSWAMSTILLFLLPYFRCYRAEGETHRKNVLITVLYLLLAFAAGAYSENASCAAIFMAVCFLVLIYRKRRAVPYDLTAALIIACIGFAYMMLAPAERGRAAQTDLLGIAKNIQRVFEAPQKTLLPLYCSFAALLAIACFRKRSREAIATAVIFFLGSVASVAVFAFAVYFPWRSLCATTVFLIIANLILLNTLWKENTQAWISALAAGLAMYCAFSFVLATGDVAVMFMESKQREAAILSGIAEGKEIIEIHEYSSNTKYAASYQWPDVYPDAGEWPNYDIAAYYGAKAVTGIPAVEGFGTE